MNNTKLRPRLSIIELRMILTDMEENNYDYSGYNKEAHLELILRLRKHIREMKK